MKTKSEKMLEKRRKLRERAQKIREERKRAKEMKEEQWTNKNEHLLVTEHRKEQRETHVNNIRKKCVLMKDVIKLDQIEKEKQRNIIKNEIDEEIQDMKKFINETISYYDEIHDQISPPEEKSVEKIVDDIEREMRKVFDIFENCFEFDPKLPESSQELPETVDKERAFTKDISKLELEISKNQQKSELMVKEIIAIKNSIELENVKFAAAKKDKSGEKMEKMRKIEKMEEKLKFISEDPGEYGEIINLQNRISEISKEKKRIEGMQLEIEEILNGKNNKK